MDDSTAAHGSGERADEGGLWIDERPGGRTGSSHRHTNRRRAGVVAAAAACAALIAVPVGLLAASNSPPVPSASGHHRVAVSGGVAKRSVLAALSATTDSGSFAFSYKLTQTPYEDGTAFGGQSCTSPGCPAVPILQDTAVQGSGTIDTNPMAMAASAGLSANGASGLQVGVRVDPTTVWEVGYADNGLTPESGDAGGTALPGFAGLVEGTLGEREGAVAMLGMASPTGYLDLVQPAVTSAAQTGTATVDGVAVTQYQLTIDPGSLATAPGTSPEEQSAISGALQTLTAQGSRSIRDLVSIDASGFIRESASTVTFADGGTVTLDAHFSNFGCAGTVLMPGQAGSSVAPPGCVSADTGLAPPASTSTTPTSATPTTPTTPTTSGTGPSGPTPAVDSPAPPGTATTSTPSTTDTTDTPSTTSTTDRSGTPASTPTTNVSTTTITTS